MKSANRSAFSDLGRIFLHWLTWIAISFALSACGSPPVIKESKLLASGIEKITDLQFIYRSVKMKTTSSYSYGRGASAADTGFYGFGDHLVSQAQPVFAQKKVALAAAKVIDGDDAIPLPFGSGVGTTIPTLVVSPTSGSVSANNHATRASYVFSAQLFDPRTRRMIWSATIDTSAWVGQDFVMKNVEKTAYDEKYAALLLRAIAERLIQDGVI